MQRWKSICRVATLLASGVSMQATAAALGEPGGSGPWPATAASTPALAQHTLYHPVQFPQQPLPLYIWGNGACRNDGLAHAAYLREIASRGYFVISLGAPRDAPTQAAPPAPAPPPGVTPDETQPAQMLEAIEWATAENARTGSAFHGRIDLARIAVGGHSCGGLQALAVSHDPRIRTTLVLNSGIYVRPGGRSGVQIDKSQLDRLHGPLLYLTGGPEDIAHPNATDDVQRLHHLPVFFGALPVGHGGTFAAADGGEWAQVSVRWLDWQLKTDADASWDFAGVECRLCVDDRWTIERRNLPAPQGPRRESLYVPVRDGTRLAMNVYRPARDGVLRPGPLPVVFAFTPYRARFRDAQGQLHELESFPSPSSSLNTARCVSVPDAPGSR